MEVSNTNSVSGSLQISTEVISHISTLASLEIEGVKEVSVGTMGMKSFFSKIPLQKAVNVELSDDVAEITVSLIVEYGCKIPSLCEKVQENVKSSVQSMTSITVSKVNIIVAGVLLTTVVTEK